jgi:hypothetical protein
MVKQCILVCSKKGEKNMTTIQRRHSPASSCAACKKSDISRVDPVSKSAMKRRISAGKKTLDKKASKTKKRVKSKNIEINLFYYF